MIILFSTGGGCSVTGDVVVGEEGGVDDGVEAGVVAGVERGVEGSVDDVDVSSV